MRAVILALGALVAVITIAATLHHELTPSSAETAFATMDMTVSSGGVCAGEECAVPLGGSFVFSVSVTSVPAQGGYVKLQTDIEMSEFFEATGGPPAKDGSGSGYKPTLMMIDEIVWPDAGGISGRRPVVDGRLKHVATTRVLPPFFVSTHTGPVVVLNMNCSQGPSSSTFTLVPFSIENTGGAGLWPLEGSVAAAKSTPLTVHCGEFPPTVTPPPFR